MADEISHGEKEEWRRLAFLGWQFQEALYFVLHEKVHQPVFEQYYKSLFPEKDEVPVMQEVNTKDEAMEIGKKILEMQFKKEDVRGR